MAAFLPGVQASRPAVAAQPAAGLALRGHPRESAWREDKRIWAAIIGYPRWSDPELEALARQEGHAAALLEAYRRHGYDLLERLFGHFVFALLEPGCGRAFCAIDRFGVYRLCYATPRAGDFVFATSADAIRAYPGIGATVSAQTLYQYLYFIDRVAAPGTIYDEQSKLPPGEALVFENGQARRWRYWQLDYRRASSASKAEHHQALRERLEQAVTRCLENESADKTASFLSGGLDSSTLTGLLAQVNAGKGRCVTIAFQHVDYDETHYAEIAARHFGLKHEIFMVGPQDVLAAIPKLSSAYDEPYSNSSAIPCYYCALASREAGDEMILAGDGGDELFGGNMHYLQDDVFEIYQKLPAVFTRVLVEPVLAHAPRRNEIPFLRRAKATLDLEGPKRFAEALYDAATAEAKIQKIMHLDLQLTLADSDLRKVLTSCTIADIRVRFPMLDDELAAMSGTIPASLLTEGGEIRRFYKDALAGFLPQAIIDKPKQGFGLPLEHYVAELPALAAFICDALSDLKRRPFFNSAFLDHMIEEVRRGRPGTHEGVAWDLAVLETWMASRNIS
jgi:asparagine synthase (glutamine-hydrolysing)